MPVCDYEDSYEALDNLMAAIDALCPAWPRRVAFAGGAQMLL